jgi:hypothetical protein
LFAVALQGAEATRVSGPVSGIVFDGPTRSLRWIVGLPGAALLGPTLGSDFDAASVSPDGRLAVAVKDGRLYLARLDGEAFLWMLLDAEASTVPRLIWSRDSSALLAGFTLWRNVGTQPDRMELARGDFEDWTAFTVAAGGDAVVAARPGGVYRMSSSERQLIAFVEAPTAVTISACGDTLFVADRASGRILTIRDWPHGAEARWLPGRIDEPVAMATEGAQVLVAAAAEIVSLDAETGGVGWRRVLPFKPTRLDRLSSGVYALNTRSSAAEPLQVLSSGFEGNVFFVPGRPAEE